MFVTTALPVKNLEDDEPLNKQLPLGNRDVRLFFLFSEGVVIMASSWSPAGAPAPDSSVNHGVVDGNQSHPFYSHKQTQTREIPIA